MLSGKFIFLALLVLQTFIFVAILKSWKILEVRIYFVVWDSAHEDEEYDNFANANGAKGLPYVGDTAEGGREESEVIGFREDSFILQGEGGREESEVIGFREDSFILQGEDTGEGGREESEVKGFREDFFTMQGEDTAEGGREESEVKGFREDSFILQGEDTGEGVREESEVKGFREDSFILQGEDTAEGSREESEVIGFREDSFTTQGEDGDDERPEIETSEEAGDSADSQQVCGASKEPDEREEEEEPLENDNETPNLGSHATDSDSEETRDSGDENEFEIQEVPSIEEGGIWKSIFDRDDVSDQEEESAGEGVTGGDGGDYENWKGNLNLAEDLMA